MKNSTISVRTAMVSHGLQDCSHLGQPCLPGFVALSQRPLDSSASQCTMVSRALVPQTFLLAVWEPGTLNLVILLAEGNIPSKG